TRPLTGTLDEIFGCYRWALALARPRLPCWSGRSLSAPLPITLLLGATPLLAFCAGPITPARLPAPPLLGRPATAFAAIAGLGTCRRETSVTTLEQTTTATTRT